MARISPTTASSVAAIAWCISAGDQSPEFDPSAAGPAPGFEFDPTVSG
jgi:hypothetical protein